MNSELDQIKDIIAYLEDRAEVRSVWAFDEEDANLREKIKADRSKLIQAAWKLRELLPE